MNILAIETSCDETAVSVVEALGEFPHATYTILGNALFSQIDIHREYGGVFPNVAKREHAATIVPMLEKAIQEANVEGASAAPLSSKASDKLYEILYREEGLADALSAFHQQHPVPNIDLIAVTGGPGLEPALWVGINFAKALAVAWNIPVVSVNHMEGHVLASLFDGNQLAQLDFPALALLISGGHTEFDVLHDWTHYACIGATRDDAVGEAFDKAARMLGLPYPGGPEISRLAAVARQHGTIPDVTLPRPMLDSDNLDFSFSGLKTAVRYTVDKSHELSQEKVHEIALAFEDAVTDVLIKKTVAAIEKTGARSFILGGGVSANTHIRSALKKHLAAEYPDIPLFFPDPSLATDNAIMIALAGHARTHEARMPDNCTDLRAEGNRSLETE